MATQQVCVSCPQAAAGFFPPQLLQDLRRSNFTSADCRKANFKGSNLQGAYFMKAVTFKTNFEVRQHPGARPPGPDMSDAQQRRQQAASSQC
jgi:uncharacterized protein YjbI with pentapeptide repeats